ncbi:MAG: ferredoxin-type protein NapG [Gammaproteobacteria bacterium]|jgi:ferredoxin-type protein NapG
MFHRDILVSIGLTVLLALLVAADSITPASAHHVLGRPSYGLSEDSNTPPGEQQEMTSGAYVATFMVFPAFPQPEQAARANLYLSRLDDGRAYDGEVMFSIVKDSLFSQEEDALGVQREDGKVYRQGFIISEPGNYIVIARFESAGQQHVLKFPTRIGDAPSSTGVAVAVAALIVVVLIATGMQRRRLLRAKLSSTRDQMRTRKAARIGEEAVDGAGGGAATVRPATATHAQNTQAMARRHFLESGVAKVSAAVVHEADSYIERMASRWIRPPFALQEIDFLLACTRCDGCIDACPHHVVFALPNRLGAAFAGTPALDLLNHGCHLCDAWPCVAACAPGALRLGQQDADGAVRIVPKLAVARIDTDHCLPYMGPECGACAGSCPIPEALHFNAERPEIDEQRCVGCGLCRQSCIVEPKAVTLRSITVHLAAVPHASDQVMRVNRHQLTQNQRVPL